MAGGFFEFQDTFAQRGGGGIGGGCVFDFGDQRGADYGSVSQATENADVAGERDAEANGDGKIREAGARDGVVQGVRREENPLRRLRRCGR